MNSQSVKITHVSLVRHAYHILELASSVCVHLENMASTVNMVKCYFTPKIVFQLSNAMYVLSSD